VDQDVSLTSPHSGSVIFACHKVNPSPPGSSRLEPNNASNTTTSPIHPSLVAATTGPNLSQPQPNAPTMGYDQSSVIASPISPASYSSGYYEHHSPHSHHNNHHTYLPPIVPHASTNHPSGSPTHSYYAQSPASSANSYGTRYDYGLSHGQAQQQQHSQWHMHPQGAPSRSSTGAPYWNNQNGSQYIEVQSGPNDSTFPQNYVPPPPSARQQGGSPVNGDIEIGDVSSLVPPPRRRVSPASAYSNGSAADGGDGTASGNGSRSGRGGNRPVGILRCSSCKATSSPEWRKGPSGRKELCNA
jgi:hypothetical protein